MKINRGGNKRSRKLKAEASAVATDESKEIILISTMHVNAGGSKELSKKKNQVLQTDL
jgi:hypothetical protein